MVEYKCEKCNKIFKQKIDYTRHMNRKIPCKELYQNIPNYTETIPNYTKAVDKSNKQQNSEKINTSVQSEQENNIKCAYCNKKFTQKSSLTRHLDKRCKVKNKQDNDKEELLQKLIKDMGELKEELKKNNEENKELKEEVKKLKVGKNKKSNNIGTQNNINQQINNNNQQNIQINNNVKILSFGKEDISHITDDLYKAILKKGMGSVPTLIEHIHFNKNKPENHNVYISNIRSNYAMIYDELNWKLKDQNEVVETLFDNINILEEKYDELLKDLSEPTIKLLREIFDDKNEPSINNEIKKRIKLLIYNKKGIPEKTKGILETNKIDQIKQ